MAPSDIHPAAAGGPLIPALSLISAAARSLMGLHYILRAYFWPVQPRSWGPGDSFMTDASALDMRAPARAPESVSERGDLAIRRPRVVLVQSQAEGASAQEISRILGNGLKAKGYDVHYVFF